MSTAVASGASSSYYEVLGVPSSASTADIRASFISKAKTFHPDKRKREVEKLYNPQAEEAHSVPGAGDWDEMFSILSRAYAVLGNEASRAQYDLNQLTASKQQHGSRSTSSSTSSSSSTSETSSKTTTNGSEKSVTNSLKKLRELQKRDAELQTSLMETTYALRRDAEEKKNGLVVVEAWYGPKRAVDSPGRFPALAVNVTKQVQVLVDDKSRLIFPAGQTKTKLIPGLYLPPNADEFEPRALRVVYTFKRKLHSSTVSDDELLLAPVKAHCVQQHQQPRLLGTGGRNNNNSAYQGEDAAAAVEAAIAGGSTELAVRSEEDEATAVRRSLLDAACDTTTTTAVASSSSGGLVRLTVLVGLACVAAVGSMRRF